jgi:hypothetical protein
VEFLSCLPSLILLVSVSLFLYLLARLACGPFPSEINNIKDAQGQIDRIGLEAKEEVDRISEAYLKKVHKQMRNEKPRS